MRRLTLPLFVLTLLAVTFATSAAHAQSGSLSGFPFLQMDPSARAAAMGGAFSAAYGDDVNVLFYNPALLNEQVDGSLSLSYLNHLADLNAGFAAYGRHVEGFGTVAAGMRYLSYGEMERADEDGQRLGGTFGAGEAALTLGAARAVDERFSYGASAHLVTFGIDDLRATALGFDVGILYLVPSQQLTVGASVNNIGTTFSSLGAAEDELPVDVRVGVTKRLRYVPLTFFITGYDLHEVGDAPDGTTTLDQVLYHVAVGGEFEVGSAVLLRLGYNHRRHAELKSRERLDPAGLSAGLGLRISRFQFDYAYNSWSETGTLHQLTVRTGI